MRSIWYFPNSANCLSPCSIQFFQIVAIISPRLTPIYIQTISLNKVDEVPLSQYENSDNK